MKVYVIEKGWYSDRHIVGVVETEEEAKKICEMLKRTDEYDCDSVSYGEYDTHQFKTSRMRFMVEHYFGDWRVQYDAYNLWDTYKDNTEDYEYHYIIYANSPEQAVKIAQDMEAEKKARQQGVIL